MVDLKYNSMYIRCIYAVSFSKFCYEKFCREMYAAFIPGGGGHFHYWRWWRTCRWTGYNFPVINIDTGYLNRPNWLLAGYSVYHRVASQHTMFMTVPRSRHQRRCVRDATDFEFFISFCCKTTIGQGISEVCNIATGYAYESFLVRYIVTGCIFLCAERFEAGSGFDPPPPPSGTPYPVERWVPPSPPGLLFQIHSW